MGTERHGGGAAHPRSRGEHLQMQAVREGGVGSSPLARGTWTFAHGSIPSLRLIPARAGNMPPAGYQAAANAAHPRSRGEHPACSWRCPPGRGSSPLARGTFDEGHLGGGAARLIPARAGNIPRQRHCPGLEAAHPRSRGEHRYGLVGTDTNAGSSPLARGTWQRGC